MSVCQEMLAETFMMLIGQKASAEVIFEVLLDEAAFLFPALSREDLEAIIALVLEEAKEHRSARRTPSNIIEFPSSRPTAAEAGNHSTLPNSRDLRLRARIHE